MEPQETSTGNKRFGSYLRRVREGRRLSLDSVEEMSTAFPERLTKSHLSRIENGQALPTFPRLFALSRIYGVPMTSIAQRFELELQRQMVPDELRSRTPSEAWDEGKKLVLGGRYMEALLLFTGALDGVRIEAAQAADSELRTDLRLGCVNCLIHLGRFEFAKSEAEEILSLSGLPEAKRMMAIEFFIVSCFRLGRYTVAMMALDSARAKKNSAEVPAAFWADLDAIRGNILAAIGRTPEAIGAYEEALERYEQIRHEFEACRTRINLASAQIDAGNRDAARQLLEKAIATAESCSYDRQRALALSHMAVLAFDDGDLEAAEAYAVRSNALARPREYLAVVFRNCYYLWRIAQARKDDAAVKANERTLRAYVGRLEEKLPEAEAFRSLSSGGEA